MKGLVLAGGSGTRLRPITYTRSKQLVPIGNKPILFYGLEAMADAGIKEVGIIIGDTGDEIRAAVGDGSRWGLTVEYIPQEQPLGLAHCVRIAREFLGDDRFVMYLGDNMLSQPIRAFVEYFDSADHGAAAQILLKQVPDPHRFGVAEVDEEGHVVRLVEKPADPPSDLALVGVYLFDPHIHEAVAAIEPSARGELEITDAIQWLIDAGHRVRTQRLEGWWIDTGKLTPLLEANRLILERLETSVLGRVDDESTIEGRVVVEEGAEIVRSTLRGPVIVASGSKVVDSYVGPFTAIASDCELTHSEIEHSVVMERATIENVPRIVDSLIGKDSVVRRSDRRPRATRLMVGDSSEVDLS